MPRNPHLCRVVLHCSRCQAPTPMCVPLRRGVPDFLQCDHQHGGGGGGGGFGCPKCGCPWPPDLDRLANVVQDLLGRRLKEWKALGAVHVEMGEVRGVA